ncbi:hypothetical protein BBO99_00004872 [Phytophthora kernoviae]|uniref:LRAT domain-containing protein n=2 Tax=Phytophthora kernoviae TaxID=325452 RepID=A0A3R7KJN0_9STRA|nr:hypothetical protein JM16_004699 [Phytophthora kernoviae]RLN02828.1 hypothetical protein BBI17_004971 [Phytophthora kernoviae]RLN79953.1 hypothetical protein BBO99_00004872 [Phytophthora kernoviae]
MNTCAVQDVGSLRPADHICIWDTSRWPFRYTHHGIIFTSGTSMDDISIAHVWSRMTGLRASQKDSRFLLTTLREFLNQRPIQDMRRVQYNSSLVAEASSLLGEVHRARADAPPVVLARCRFLLGLGEGHFSILSLNCEHVALWCTTGVGWSKQLLSRTETKVPFLTASAKSAQVLERLELQLKTIREEGQEKNKQLEALRGKRVYLRLKDTGRFAKRLGDALYLVTDDPSEKDWAFRQKPTALRLQVRVLAYNYVRVKFEDFDKPGDVLCASASALKLAHRRAILSKRRFRFELGWGGELQSLRLRRWFIGAQTRDGLLRPFSSRDKAAAFEIVDADQVDALWVALEDPIEVEGGESNSTRCISNQTENESETEVTEPTEVSVPPMLPTFALYLVLSAGLDDGFQLCWFRHPQVVGDTLIEPDGRIDEILP